MKMADKYNKHPLNGDGRYYVDLSCICCGTCTAKAPENLTVDMETESGYFFKQPENNQEMKACLKAMTECPVNAIGDNG